MEDAVIKRIPPHSREAEQAVIGAMLMNADAITAASEILTQDDFYEARYGLVFKAMCELNEAGKPADTVTLADKLRESGAPEELLEPAFIRTLLMSVPTSANVRHYAEIVSQKATLRRLIKVTAGIENRCYDDREDLQDILDTTEKEIFQVLQQKTSVDYTPIRELAGIVLDNIESAARTDSHITGISTGFIDLDYKTSGFQRSDLILIAARPSMGKTALVLNIAQYMAFRKNMPVAIFSLEMSKEQLMNRLLAMESTVNSQSIRTGKLTDDEWSKIIQSLTEMSESNMIIDDTPSISLAELRSRARKYKLDHDIQAIFIDYLQLMSAGGSGRRSENRQQEISDISRALKSLARELNIPVVALSQLNRSVEQRDDHRPMLSDLRESGAIEQDADVVMFIYRDDYYNKDTEEKNVAEIIIAKQRNGPVGTIKMIWLPEYTKFANMKHDRQKSAPSSEEVPFA
ncbi:MAG: replicative DNA helicase [Lachnospiraceae bacterium]|nr:replicative DNA helicase [Lachnospiraceae bacterium]